MVAAPASSYFIFGNKKKYAMARSWDGGIIWTLLFAGYSSTSLAEWTEHCPSAGFTPQTLNRVISSAAAPGNSVGLWWCRQHWQFCPWRHSGCTPCPKSPKMPELLSFSWWYVSTFAFKGPRTPLPGLLLGFWSMHGYSGLICSGDLVQDRLSLFHTRSMRAWEVSIRSAIWLSERRSRTYACPLSSPGPAAGAEHGSFSQ